MPCWSSCNDYRPQEMKQESTHAVRTDRLGLTYLLEKLGSVGLCLSDILLPGQRFRVRVAGWSMSPALHTGDQITVEPASLAQLEVGDLLLFHHHDRLICHRLVAIQETGTGPQLITKGDAAVGYSEVIQMDQVLGRVVAVTRRWPWASSLSQRLDRWLARRRDEVAQGFLALQGVRSYRRMMRAMLSRCFAYYVGVPEGKRWFRYHRIGDRKPPGELVGYQRFHLVAKLPGICVGSVRVTANEEGYWIDDLYVRIRYRGLGVGSQLLRLASHLASQNGAGRLLATVAAENSAALSLFDKMEFHTLTGSKPDGPPILCRDLPR